MFRTFISWRYLIARPTNLIGMCGITVAVFALIVILSIMTGFLEENRDGVRGGLADVLIQPDPGLLLGSAETPPATPAAIREELEGDARVEGHATRLVAFGILTPSGTRYGDLLARPSTTDLLMVEVVGIDIAGVERMCLPALALGASTLGALFTPPAPRDEFTVSELGTALTGLAAGRPARPPSAPVANPLFPFLVDPPGRAARRAGPSRQRLPGILIGDRFFYSLGLSTGDEVQLALLVFDEELNHSHTVRSDFLIAGSFRSGDFETDLGRVYLDRGELSRLLNSTRIFSEVLVRLEDYESDADAFVEDLRPRLAARGAIGTTESSTGEHVGDPNQVLTWEDARRTMLGAIENERVMMGIMLSLILMVAGFTIFAILSMMVTEKRRDIGILRALGATPRGIQQIFLLIALWDALIGATIGGLLGVLTAKNIDALEFWLADTFGYEIFKRDVFLFDHIPAVVEPLSIALIIVWSFLCSLGFAALPAWRASRMAPLDALRYE